MYKKSINIFLPLANSYANRGKVPFKKLLLPCPGSRQVSASQIPKREHVTAGKKCFVPDPGWNNRRKLAVGAAAGITSNLQEKPSRDTKTDLFLCLLQHICLGWDSRQFWNGIQFAILTNVSKQHVLLKAITSVSYSRSLQWFLFHILFWLLYIYHVNKFQVHTEGKKCWYA